MWHWHSPPVPKEKTLKLILMCTFYVSRKWFRFTYTPNEIWKILKSPEMDFDVYIFTFRVIFFVSRIRQTQIWKLPKFPEMGSDVYIFMFCVIFFVLRIRQTQIWKNTKIPWNGIWYVDFYLKQFCLIFF